MVVAGDFNRDGYLDLAVTNRDSNTVSILAGNGDGTFAPKVDFATAAGPLWLTIGNFNADGTLDLAIVSSSTNAISVLLGNGDGSFQAHSDYSTTGTPYAVTTADVNGDGKLDLITNSSNTITVLLGNGDGSFRGGVDYTSGPGPTAILMADIDGDGILDAVAPNSNGTTISILRGNGDGSFKPSTDYDAGASPFGVAIGDFNGDGRLDVVVADLNSPQTIAILLQAPMVTLSDAGVSFGNQLVGTTSAAQTVTLSNTGSAPLSISNIAASGDYAQANTCGTTVATGTSCNISVTFTPTTTGSRSGAVTVTDNAPGSPHSVSLAGTGTIATVPMVSLLPSSVAFGNTGVGTTSAVRSSTLTNTATAALSIASIVPSGDFAVTTTGTSCPYSGGIVNPAASCTIDVTFTPTVPGTRAGSITITDNAADSPQSISLTGSGQVNPVPFINQPLVPASTAPGGSGFPLTVNGSGFVSGSIVNWNGTARTTTFVSSTQLMAAITAPDIAAAGSGSVIVFNPAPGGGSSNTAFFEITVPTSSVSLGKKDYDTGTGPRSVIKVHSRPFPALDVQLPESGYSGLSALMPGPCAYSTLSIKTSPQQKKNADTVNGALEVMPKNPPSGLRRTDPILGSRPRIPNTGMKPGMPGF
jgi:hypothetical protein